MTSGASAEGVAGLEVAAVTVAVAGFPAAPDIEPEGNLQGSFLADVVSEQVEETQPVLVW